MKRKTIKKKKTAAGRFLVSLFIIAVIVCTFVIIGNNAVRTNASETAEKYYKSITIESGDTLYSIAEEYGCTVDELKSMNNISSDTIYAGQMLIVSYYK